MFRIITSNFLYVIYEYMYAHIRIYDHIYIYIYVYGTHHSNYTFLQSSLIVPINHLDSQGPLGFGFRADSERSEGGGINDWDGGRYTPKFSREFAPEKVNFDEGRSTKGW